ncbi:MAG: hypothetical protein PHC66_04995 [Candidatus Nanoarchaeia archaeon]|nr:hypothetical protein [Candidatus Nanoarchaeia archaeon]MDD5239752.1 hypothetical protein [Candidatus Nanoarchaeia archaeon]
MSIQTNWGQLKPEPKKAPVFKETLAKKYGIKTYDELKRNVDLILHKNRIRKYEYEEESFGPSVEPKYFWVIDFLRVMQYKIEKHWEKMGASVVSQFFGEMSTRRQFLERRGMEIMATINTVVKTIINLLYDLRELDRRLQTYDQLKAEDPKDVESAEYSLKRVWMDEVDVRKGGASINNMAQKGLEFITMRDAFMIAKTAKNVDELELNDRVKRILKMRLDEYEKWKTESNSELHMRRRVEKAYLKSEVDSLKLYSQWARPYLKAAQQLQFEDIDIKDQDLIQAFDQNFLEIKVRGYNEMRLKDLFEKRGIPRKITPPATWTEEKKKAYLDEQLGPAIYDVAEVTFRYRTKPALVSQSQQGGGAYRHLGKLNIVFESYLLTKEDYELLERQEQGEAMDFIEGMTKESLDAMRVDIDRYLNEEDEKEEGKAAEAKKPGKPIIDEFFGMFGGGGGGKGLLAGFNLFNKAKYAQTLLTARKKVADRAFNVYDIFKKSQGLLSFPYYPSYETPKAGK